MDSFQYILYVYKRTLLRTSGREKDKKTRCGSIRRSNGTTGGEKTAPVDLTEMYALWANRGGDFIADVKTIPGNTVWRSTVKSQQVNHYVSTDVANNGVRVILPEGNNHRRVSAIQPYVAVFIWRRLS